MGSATRESLTSARASLASLGSIDLEDATQLLQAGRTIGTSAQLLTLLADRVGDAAQKRAVIERVFGSDLSPRALELLSTVVNANWSTSNDLLAAIEEIGIRAVATSAPEAATIDREIFAVGRAVAANPELELALGNVRSSGEGKAALVSSLLKGKASAHTIAIVTELVRQPRGRRIRSLLAHAATIVSDQEGAIVGVVTTARTIPDAQLARLQDDLAGTYGRTVRLNQVIDPDVIGGVRIQIGNDVIDGTVAARLKELKLQLAS